MCSQRHLGHRMVVTLQANGGCIADVADDFDAGTCLADTEAFACKDLLVALGMQFREALTELKLITINVQSAISALLSLYGIRRQTFGIDAEEITQISSIIITFIRQF